MKFIHRLLAAGFAAAVSLTPVALGHTTPAQAAPTDTARQAATPVSRVAASIAAEWRADPDAFTGGGLADAILALSASGGHPDVLAQLVTAMKADTKNYVASAGSAGKVAIVAAATGQDARNFGGVDLVAQLQAALAKDRTAGGDFAAPLAILGLVRNGAPVPQPTVDWLLSRQTPTGAFGYGTPVTPDPDTTAMIVDGLSAVRDQPAVAAALTKARGWAASTLTPAGHWENYSPVNTTGLMVSAFADAGTPFPTALTWLRGQVLADGGMPNVLGGTESNVMASTQGILGLAGVGYAKVRAAASTGPSSAPSPSRPGTPAPRPSAATPTPAKPTSVTSARPTPSQPGTPGPVGSAAPSAPATNPGLPRTGQQ